MATEDDPQCLHDLEEARLDVGFLLTSVPTRQPGEPRGDELEDWDVSEDVEEFFEKLAGWYPPETTSEILATLQRIGAARACYYVSGPRAESWKDAVDVNNSEPRRAS
jgi:hypothetical protein